MNSKTQVPEYKSLRLDGRSAEWRVNTKNIIPAKAHRIIADYYHKEDSGVFPRSSAIDVEQLFENVPEQPINRAYPRHHALILAARCSSSKLVSRKFPFLTTGYEHACSEANGSLSRFAYACAHDPNCVTMFTQVVSVYQKHHLTGLAGLSGLLVARLMDHSNPKMCSMKQMKKHAEITKQFLHSALAAECIVGNRYYRNIVANRRGIKTSKHPVGFITSNVKSNLVTADVSPDALRATQDELRDTYNANIGRLLSMIQMFKRGFVSSDQIREDPEFVRMMTAFWRYGNQAIKLKEEFDFQPDPVSMEDFIPFKKRKEARRFSILSTIAEMGAIVPMLYQYDIAYIFDNAIQSYANYIKVSKHTWIRLANDGSTASFLAFAAIEPQLVTEDLAPQVGGGGDGDGGAVFNGLSLQSCANHIPSSHPVFGALRTKLRCHIMRTADAVNLSSERVHPNQDAPLMGVPRDNHQRFCSMYAPFYNMVEDTRRPEFTVDILQTFPKTHQNTGIILSVSEATMEFKERVYAHGMVEAEVVALPIRHRRNIYVDSDDEKYEIDFGDDDEEGDDDYDEGDDDDHNPYSDDDESA
jgi:hypothetical protein